MSALDAMMRLFCSNNLGSLQYFCPMAPSSLHLSTFIAFISELYQDSAFVSGGALKHLQAFLS